MISQSEFEKLRPGVLAEGDPSFDIGSDGDFSSEYLEGQYHQFSRYGVTFGYGSKRRKALAMLVIEKDWNNEAGGIDATAPLLQQLDIGYRLGDGKSILGSNASEPTDHGEHVIAFEDRDWAHIQLAFDKEADELVKIEVLDIPIIDRNRYGRHASSARSWLIQRASVVIRPRILPPEKELKKKATQIAMHLLLEGREAEEAFSTVGLDFSEYEAMKPLLRERAELLAELHEAPAALEALKQSGVV